MLTWKVGIELPVAAACTHRAKDTVPADKVPFAHYPGQRETGSQKTQSRMGTQPGSSRPLGQRREEEKAEGLKDCTQKEKDKDVLTSQIKKSGKRGRG